MRQFLSVLFTAVLLLQCVNGVAAESDKYLLLHDMNYNYATPSFIARNKDYLDTLPVDGLVVYVAEGRNNISIGLLNPRPLSVEAIASVLAPLNRVEWQNVTHNFALIYSPGAFLPPSATLDVFDDAAWAISASNLANFGQAIRNAGLEGIVFDNENYSGYASVGAGKRACDTKAHTLTECQDQMKLRGRQLMSALQSTFPDVVVLFTQDINVSNATMQSDYRNSPRCCEVNDISRANGMLGPLLVGFAQAVQGNSVVVQGGAWCFPCHTYAEFDYFLSWQQSAARDTGECDSYPRATGCGGFIAADDRTSWAGMTSSGAAISGYKNMDESGNPISGSSGTAETVRNALARSDRYVWLYMDVGARPYGSMLEPSGNSIHRVKQAFLDAVRSGRDAARVSVQAEP